MEKAKTAVAKMEEKNQEEWRGIFTTIELPEENILKVKDENDRLKTNFLSLLQVTSSYLTWLRKYFNF